MSPLPIPRHQIIASNLLVEFSNQLRKCKRCRAVLPVDYKVADDTIIQPDMLVVCGDMKKPFLDFAPLLVAEILSPSTHLKDRHTKFSIYEKQGVKYYLIISVEKELVEIYELQNGAYQMQKKESVFTYHFYFDECQAVIDFKEIWR